MTTITIVVQRDPEGRLHGTIADHEPGGRPYRFTGVIELVARIEDALDQAAPPSHPSPPDPHEERP